MSFIIRMKNLPMTAGAADVRTFFSGLKIPDGAVHIIGGDEGEVFVGFASDEDARIAMTKQGQTIHNAKIKMDLSSKTEQSSVISARKNGIYQSPTSLEELVPPAPMPLSSQLWTQPGSNPYAARSGYEASYPGPNAFSALTNFSARPEATQQPVIPSPKKQETPKEAVSYKESPRDDYNYKEASSGEYSYEEEPRDDYGYKASFQSPPHNRFGPGVGALDPPKPAPMQNGPPHDNYGFRGNDHGGDHGPRGIQEDHRGPGGRMPQPQHQQSGDSWRDSNYSQTKNDFGRNKFNNRNAPPQQEFRKPPILPTPPSAQFQPLNPQFHNNGPPNQNPPARPFQNRPLPNATSAPSFQNMNGGPGPAPFQNGPPINRGGPPRNMPSEFAPHPTPNIPMKPMIQSIMATPLAAPSGEKFYVELTRLPNELLRPAALEAFVHPTCPLTLSSVKTVFGPGGIHMHTIIRLDSIADYATLMRRNGEQGIKIQQSDKKSFDSADDGAPVPLAVAAPPVIPKTDDDSGSRRKSRWSDKSPLKERREMSPPRRGSNRSRSPIRKRRRSRSPRRRDEHTDPTRWCIQVTNVPFRMKDEDLLEWFSEKVRPAKLSRTYYSDGNASDRWVAEFSSESLMRRAFSIRTLCNGRTLKLSYIDNEKADEIMKIEDVYGKEKRQINEEAREEAEKANPPSFFNQPSMGARGPPANNFNGPPNTMQNGMPNNPPMRGGFAPRGNSFPPRGGMMGGPPQPNGRGQPGPGGPPPFFQNNGPVGGGGPAPFNNGPPDGGFRGGFHGDGGFRGGRGGRGGGGGGRGGFRGGRDDLARNEMMELIQSLGPQGTVLSCSGFPTDVTLEDVADFFGRYNPDRNSIRIRRGDDGVMTGECMLACYNVNDARQAAHDLDGQRFHNAIVSIRQI